MTVVVAADAAVIDGTFGPDVVTHPYEVMVEPSTVDAEPVRVTVVALTASVWFEPATTVGATGVATAVTVTVFDDIRPKTSSDKSWNTYVPAKRPDIYTCKLRTPAKMAVFGPDSCDQVDTAIGLIFTAVVAVSDKPVTPAARTCVVGTPMTGPDCKGLITTVWFNVAVCPPTGGLAIRDTVLLPDRPKLSTTARANTYVPDTNLVTTRVALVALDR